MLTITQNAATAIRALTQTPQAPAGAGLRITADGTDAGRLMLQVQPAPGTADQVIESEGAMLFLDTTAAAALADKTLDAHTDPNGGVTFTVDELPG